MADESSNANETKNEPVTITAPPGGGVTVDPQNPLPEPSFFWRRWFAFAICANALVFAWFAAAWLVGGEQWNYLYGLTRLLIYFGALAITYYFVAPSASELTSMIQSAGIIKKSIGAAADTAQNATNRPETAQTARFHPSVAADSGITSAPSSGPEIDAAPRSKT